SRVSSSSRRFMSSTFRVGASRRRAGIASRLWQEKRKRCAKPLAFFAAGRRIGVAGLKHVAAGCRRALEMTPERYERLCQLFDQAQSLPAEQRTAFLDEVGAADPALRAELASLLADD